MKRGGETERIPNRQAILRLLKRQGPSDPGTLAAQLEISAMAVRQHLYSLSAVGLVTYQTDAGRVGRPAKRWRLTPAAAGCFPDAHADLAMGLINAAERTFGTEGVKRMVDCCANRQLAHDRARLPADAPLRARIEALVAFRNEDGYMTEARNLPDGSIELIHNHCPVAAAAAACNGLCDAELQVFRGVLGNGVAIERTEHLLAGTRRCVYRILQGATKEPRSAKTRSRAQQAASASETPNPLLP